MNELDELSRRRSRRNSLCESIAEGAEEGDDGSSAGGSSTDDTREASLTGNGRQHDEKLMRKVRRNKDIRALVHAMWQTPHSQRRPSNEGRTSKRTPTTWSRAEYADFHRSICVMLMQLNGEHSHGPHSARPLHCSRALFSLWHVHYAWYTGEEFDDKAAWETMLFDFENDAAGKAHVTHDDVAALLLEVAEMALKNSTDPAAYLDFFAMLLEKTTVVIELAAEAAAANAVGAPDVPSRASGRRRSFTESLPLHRESRRRSYTDTGAQFIAGRAIDLSAARAWRHTWPRTPRGGNLMSPRD
jgi:hypothetical protein